VNGLLQTVTKIAQYLQNLPLIVKLLLEGIVLSVIMVALQMWFEGQTEGFMAYIPPIGLVIYGVLMFLVEPIALGAVNIALINVLFGTRGWQVNFWLNGIFLILVFTTINVVLETVLGWSFIIVAVFDVVVLSIPFGCIARFSNGGWKKPIN
jgi:hypothetical protein